MTNRAWSLLCSAWQRSQHFDDVNEKLGATWRHLVSLYTLASEDVWTCKSQLNAGREKKNINRTKSLDFKWQWLRQWSLLVCNWTQEQFGVQRLQICFMSYSRERSNTDKLIECTTLNVTFTSFIADKALTKCG